jgi:hypothetical protein
LPDFLRKSNVFGGWWYWWFYPLRKWKYLSDFLRDSNVFGGWWYWWFYPLRKRKYVVRLFEGPKQLGRVMMLVVLPPSKMKVFCPTFWGTATSSAGDDIGGFTPFENESITPDFFRESNVFGGSWY